MRPDTTVFEACWGQRTVEAAAYRCLDKCRKLTGLSELPLPIPVEEWIEGPLGIQLGFGDLSELGSNTLGASFIESNQIMVDEQVLSHQGRTRFTCAHELGHFVLHGHAAHRLRKTRDYGKLEFQANCFASAFLMPVPLVEREIIDLCRQQGTALPRLVAELMHSTPGSEQLWKAVLLPHLSQRFDVAWSAAIVRCRTMQPRIDRARPLLPPLLARRLLQPIERRAFADTLGA